MLIYQEFLALNVNEDMAFFDPRERLRYAVHEIAIRYKDGQIIKFGDLCKILKNEFKIDISESNLKEIFEKWDKFHEPDYTIFKKEDKDWMDAWPFQNYIKTKIKDKQNFGKHRKKDYPAYTPPATTYGRGGNYGGNYKYPDPYGYYD